MADEVLIEEPAVTVEDDEIVLYVPAALEDCAIMFPLAIWASFNPMKQLVKLPAPDATRASQRSEDKGFATPGPAVPAFVLNACPVNCTTPAELTGSICIGKYVVPAPTGNNVVASYVPVAVALDGNVRRKGPSIKPAV